MERNLREYSYNPVKLEWRWLNPPVMDYRGVHFSSIQQNILMACYYDKQNEEELSLQLGVPTAYLEDEIRKHPEHELLTEKNGFYLTNVMIQTKSAMEERFRVKEDMLKENAERIKAFFAENEEKLRSVGFYGNDMSVNSLKWLVLTRTLTFCYEILLEDELSKNFPAPESGPFAELTLVEQELAPKGDNYVLFWTSYETAGGLVVCYWIRFNSVSHRFSDVQISVLTQLMKKQPETEHDQMICTELIEKGCAIRIGDEIKPNYPCFTKQQNQVFCDLLEPFVRELFQSVLDRVEITKKITLEHTHDRFKPYIKDMMLMQMEEEVGNITRLLVEESWGVPWTGMNPTNLIILTK